MMWITLLFKKVCHKKDCLTVQLSNSVSFHKLIEIKSIGAHVNVSKPCTLVRVRWNYFTTKFHVFTQTLNRNFWVIIQVKFFIIRILFKVPEQTKILDRVDLFLYSLYFLFLYILLYKLMEDLKSDVNEILPIIIIG